MKSLIDYINEAKWEDWEKEYFIFRQENGFKGTIDDLVSDENGFSSEMASDFYKSYLQDKEGKSKADKYDKDMKNMSDAEKALKTDCKNKSVEEIAWLVASAIESALPVEIERHEIPFTRGLSKSTYKVNFNGKPIYFYDKCYEFAGGYGKGYKSKPGFTVICGKDCKYKYGNMIDCEEDTRKGFKGTGAFRKWLWDDSSVEKLVKTIEKKVNDSYAD